MNILNMNNEQIDFHDQSKTITLILKAPDTRNSLILRLTTKIDQILENNYLRQMFSSLILNWLKDLIQSEIIMGIFIRVKDNRSGNNRDKMQIKKSQLAILK